MLNRVSAALICAVMLAPAAVDAARTGRLNHVVGKIEAGETLRIRMKPAPGPVEIALTIERGTGVLFSVADPAGVELCSERSDYCAFAATGDVLVRLVNRSAAQAAYRLQWATPGR